MFSNRSPVVSVIINNYNYDRFLVQAIDSALSQTYSPLEIIVVDDGSTDRSQEIIESYGDRITPVFQTNGKQGAAFNSGFAASKGEIILFLDSDDYLFPHAIESIVAAWQPQFAKMHYRLKVVDAEGKSLGSATPPHSLPLAEGEVWRTLLEEGTYTGVSSSGNAISRAALTQVMPIPNDYRTIADDYLSNLIPFYGEVGAIQEPLAAYRIHNANQWALIAVNGDRFHRFVHHDLQSRNLLAQKAEELGLPLPKDFDVRFHGHLWSRMASLRLDPVDHPIPADRPLSLIYWGMRSLWKYSQFSQNKKLAYSLWFLWVGLLPLPLAKMAITWLFVPYQRPKFMSRSS
jgi:glycosyltransferase involved in cell wall biosynthesis